MRIRVTFDRAQIAAVAGGIAKQVKFAAVTAATRTARQLALETPDEAERQLRGPTTRYTRGGVFSARATVSEPIATVGYKDRQAAYMAYQVSGGRRVPRRVALRLPGRALALDREGNVPSGTIARLRRAAAAKRGRISKRTRERLGLAPEARVFYGVPRGMPNLPAALWLRLGPRGRDGIEPLVVFPRRSAGYRPLFDFTGWGDRRARALLPDQFARALREAIATAR